jgi:hypothetical protein
MPRCCCLNNKGNEILFRINIPPPLTTIAGLVGAGHCLGLPCHQTSHQWTSSYGATLKPWFTHRHLILKKILSSVFLRQEQTSGSNLALLCHTSVCAASLSAMYWDRWPYVWTSALNWYETQLFFSLNTSVVLLDFQPYSDPHSWSVVLLGHISDIQLLDSKSLFCPHITSQSLGMEFFCTLYKLLY